MEKLWDMAQLWGSGNFDFNAPTTRCMKGHSSKAKLALVHEYLFEMLMNELVADDPEKNLPNSPEPDSVLP